LCRWGSWGLLAASLRGLNNDVYFQVGLLTTIGLSAKNAILIVEFAKDLMEKEGKGIIEATLEASKDAPSTDPDDPWPLSWRHAAGDQYRSRERCAKRRRYGCDGGMLSATLLAIFFVPVFFVVVRRRFTRHKD
jgi:multidrug efflux pump